MCLTPRQQLRPHRARTAIIALLVACISPFSAAYAQSPWNPGSGIPILSSEISVSSLIDRAADESGFDTKPLWGATKLVISSLQEQEGEVPTPISLGKCSEDRDCEKKCEEYTTKDWFQGRYDLALESSCEPGTGEQSTTWPIPEADKICSCSLSKLSPSSAENPVTKPESGDFTCHFRALESTWPKSSDYSYWSAPELRAYGGSVTIASLTSGMSLTHTGYYSEGGERSTFGLGFGLRISTLFGPIFLECFFETEVGSLQ